MIKLKNLEIKFFKITATGKTLEVQKEEILGLIKGLQEDYFIKKILEKKVYEKSISIYNKRLAEIKKRIRLEGKNDKSTRG